MPKYVDMVSKDKLEAIGRIITRFSNLEYWIGFRIYTFMNVDEKIGQMITAHMHFPELLDLLSSLYLRNRKIKNVSSDESFKNLLNRCQNAFEDRNRIAHSVFGGGNGEMTIRIKMVLKRNKGLEHQHQSMSCKELNNIADNIGNLVGEILHFFSSE